MIKELYRIFVVLKQSINHWWSQATSFNLGDRMRTLYILYFKQYNIKDIVEESTHIFFKYKFFK